jgi:hypothetical protein
MRALKHSRACALDVRKRRKPVMTAPQQIYEARPSGEIDYEALCADVNRDFPYIVKRLAE